MVSGGHASPSARAAHRARRVHPLAGALAVWLALWLGLFPAFQTFHFLFASHSHRYCSVHEQVEDVAGGGSEAAGKHRLADSSEDEPALRRAESSSLDRHVADSLLSYQASRCVFARVAAAAGVRQPDSPRLVLPDWPAIGASIPVLALAPKHSPPPLAS